MSLYLFYGMPVSLIKIYNTTHVTEIAVLKSKLEAAGLHPFVQNYEHAQIAHIDILALGGMNILIPEDEAKEALAILKDQTMEFEDTDVFDDYDPPDSYKNQTPYKASRLPIVLMLIAAVLIIIFTPLDVLSIFLVGFAALLFHAQNLATKQQKENK